MEHRWGQRIHVDIAVSLRLAGGTLVPARLVDLSVSGALVQTAEPLALLSPVTVLLDRYLSEPWARTVSGHVVRETFGGVGIEWAEFSPPEICAELLEAAERLSDCAGPQPDRSDESEFPQSARYRRPAAELTDASRRLL